MRSQVLYRAAQVHNIYHRWATHNTKCQMYALSWVLVCVVRVTLAHGQYARHRRAMEVHLWPKLPHGKTAPQGIAPWLSLSLSFQSEQQQSHSCSCLLSLVNSARCLFYDCIVRELPVGQVCIYP